MGTSAASDCFICRKHRGQIVVPGGTIIEDDLLSADHAQIRPGQTTAYLGYLMAEPKRHVPGLEGLTDEEAQALGLWTARLSRALVATEGADHVYAFVMGDAVPHVHVHVVARYPGAPEEFRGPRVDEWPQAPRGGAAEIDALCARLRLWLSADAGSGPSGR
jgi:diadenosine tetraphosphate (Ap4A) HIT family hydrolase